VLDAHPLAQVLTSMPGIGVRTAARILREVGDGTTFASSGHLAAYAGLAPVTRRSGSSIRGEHPPRGGNKQLKRAFFLAAFAALADPTNRTYYDRKRAQGKRHNAALICLARRRCDVLYAMLRDKIPTNHGQRTRSPPLDRTHRDTHPYDVQELVGTGVPGVLVEEVAVTALLVRFPPLTTLSSSRPRDSRWKVEARRGRTRRPGPRLTGRTLRRAGPLSLVAPRRSVTFSATAALPRPPVAISARLAEPPPRSVGDVDHMPDGRSGPAPITRDGSCRPGAQPARPGSVGASVHPARSSCPRPQDVPYAR
jgi:hypothetical protein